MRKFLSMLLALTMILAMLAACNNNVDEAMKLYDFYAKDLQSLPDFDVVPPTAFQQTKSAIADLFNWADANQDKIIGAYNFFQQIRTGQPIDVVSTPINNVQPIPNE